MRIEKLQSPTDETLDELLDVWEKSVRSSHHFLNDEDIAYFRPLVRNQYFQSVELFVTRKGNGRVAAFMGLGEDLLEMLFVLPEEQGNGHGKAFIDYAVNRRGIYKVDVNEDNTQAYQFYLHMGYKVVGRDGHDASGQPFPILHLQVTPEDLQRAGGANGKKD